MPVDSALVARAMDRGELTSVLRAAAGEPEPRLDVAIPLAGPYGYPAGAVYVQAPMGRFLTQLTARWPVPSGTGRIRLSRRDGDSVIFVASPRGDPTGGLSERIPDRRRPGGGEGGDGTGGRLPRPRARRRGGAGLLARGARLRLAAVDQPLPWRRWSARCAAPPSSTWPPWSASCWPWRAACRSGGGARRASRRRWRWRAWSWSRARSGSPWPWPARTSSGTTTSTGSASPSTRPGPARWGCPRTRSRGRPGSCCAAWSTATTWRRC